MNEDLKRLFDESRKAALGANDYEAGWILDIIYRLSEGGKSVMQRDLLRHETRPKRLVNHRKIREAIRRARVVFAAPILSCQDGYRIPRGWDEVHAFMDRQDAALKARVTSILETSEQVGKTFGCRSRFGFTTLLREVVTVSGTAEVDSLTEAVVRMKFENDQLRARLAKWGRPSRAKKAGLTVPALL